MSAAYSKLSHQ